MSTLQIKESIIDKLDELDEQTLQAVHILLNGLSAASVKSENPVLIDDDVDYNVHGSPSSREEVVGYEVDGTPITKKEFATEAAAIVKEMRAGKKVSAEDVNKETEQWLNSIK